MKNYRLCFIPLMCVLMCCYQGSNQGVKASSNHTREITIPAESCIQSPVRQNVTLQGGIEAGVFKKIAQFVAMQLCIRMCCDQKGCDVALLSGKNCYGVQCYSEESCKAVPAKKAPSSLMISHVTIKGEGGIAAPNNLSNPIPHNLKCTVTEPEYGVTLTGGLKAGNFTDVGKVEKIDACTRLCCVSEKCNLALFIRGNCFLVSCFTEDLCKTVKTETRNYRPTVAYVRRWTTALALESALTLSRLPATDSKLSCKNSDIRHNATLKGGYRAGNFTDLGKVSNMSTCIRYCCGRRDCDVAMMLELNCYAVHCFSEKLCKPVTARKSVILSSLNPKLSYMISRTEEVLPKHIPLEDGAYCQPSVISYDVTLKGGVRAGSFTPLGQVDSIQTCISLCCQRPSCDVAFMLKTTCYAIKCASEDVCEQVPARVSEYSPRLSYVRRYTDNDITKEQKLTKMGYLTNTNDTTPSAVSSEDHYCTESEVMYNVTLRGGITSGRFRDRGKVPSIKECAEICCIAKECDLAFMLKNQCFSVSCSSQTLCDVVKAKSSVFNPTIVYIYARTINDMKGLKRRNERLKDRSAVTKTYDMLVKESDLRKRLGNFVNGFITESTRKRRDKSDIHR